MVKPGKYQAKVSDYGIANFEDKEGRPVFEIWFDVEGQGSVRWTGFLGPKSIDRTLESLAFCGFSGADLMVLADGKASGALDMESPVNITVEWETNKDGSVSDKYTRVQWINRIGRKTADPVKTAGAKAKLAQFSGDWARVRQEQGVKASAPKKSVAQTPSEW